MASGNNIYTIIIKNKSTSGSSSNNVTSGEVRSDGTIKLKNKKPTTRKSKGRPKSGKAVEPNRISRVWNSTMNKLTNGIWEKSQRAGNATVGIITSKSMVGVTIATQFAMNYVFEQWNNFKKQQQERNEKDFLKIRVGAIDLGNGDSYSINRSFFSGRIHYKTNR